MYTTQAEYNVGKLQSQYSIYRHTVLRIVLLDIYYINILYHFHN